MSEVNKQLLELRYVTERTGAIHEIQSRNLNLWGYIVFREIYYKDIVAYFNWDKRQVVYNIANFPKLTKKRLSGLTKDCGHLNEWVQGLLGPEYRVVVETSKKFTYSGRRSAKLPKPNIGVDFSG